METNKQTVPVALVLRPFCLASLADLHNFTVCATSFSIRRHLGGCSLGLLRDSTARRGAKPARCALTASYFSHRALAACAEPVICFHLTQALFVQPKNASMAKPIGGTKKNTHGEEQ
jgi:hypothetical protein